MVNCRIKKSFLVRKETYEQNTCSKKEIIRTIKKAEIIKKEEEEIV